jgi:filamentous hemagglutinin family protein
MNSSLNHVYRIIWNAALGLWQVASEATRGRGKTGSSQQARKARRALAAATAMTLASPAAWAVLPTGGNVVAGSATISQAGSALNITQGSDKAAINWQSFSIGQGNSVNFVQPSATSVALNRVLGNDVSVIQGAINANGQVFLVNQNGVLFTPTAQVNVGGIVASTQNISTADFMAGKYEFSGNSTATVENQGSITTANGGVVALVAAKVINSGTITALQGTVGLAAGNTVLLDLGGPVKIQVTEGALNAAIEQSGGIRADGGTIYLTAKAAGNLAASVINHSGVTRALTMASLTGESQGQTGSIALSADIISQQGTLDASGVAAGTSGGQINLTAGLIIDAGITKADGQVDGGRITQKSHEIMQSSSAKVSAVGVTGLGGLIQFLGGGQPGGNVYLSGQVTATGRRKGGQIDATAHSLTLAGATLDTSGTGVNAQAGKLRIGGGWQGNDADIVNAVTTMLSSNTTLTNEGVDGMVVVWSDGKTTYGAKLNARGSDVEISGKENLSANLDGVVAKTLLLDPKNITIVEEISTSSFNALTLANMISNGPGSETDDFGQQVLELANGRFVVTAPNASITSIFGNRANVGRVYVFDKTGQIFAILTGDIAGSKLGSGGVFALKGKNANNFVINSPEFSRSATQIASGAVTWFNSDTGRLASNTIANKVDGTIINQTNSLVGSRSNDRVGSGGITVLSNGNYVVSSPNFSDSTGNSIRGAVTWMSGENGKGRNINFEVSSNSLVGSNVANANERIGSGGVFEVAGVTPGTVDYVVSSPNWNKDRGAVTRVSGENGQIAGTNTFADQVGSTNSVTGATAGDMLSSGGVVALSDGAFVYISPDFNIQPGSVLLKKVGAVHWVAKNRNPIGNTNQAVNATPSITGAADNDRVGSGGVTALDNGAFVVNSPEHNGQRGAVTWLTGSMLNGLTVSASNSLTGATANDQVGLGGIIKLSDGNYVVNSYTWSNSAGAVTWINGSTGNIFGSSAKNGFISSSNSLVGGSAQASVSGANAETGKGGVVALAQGRYVVVSPKMDDFLSINNTQDVGAVTWANTGGIAGIVTSSNSLIGNSAFDQIGSGGAVALANGNFVIGSAGVNIAGKANAGLVAVINGSQAVTGNLVTGSFTGSQLTRLAGSNADDFVGGSSFSIPGERTLYALNNGNVVVSNFRWRLNTGAVTWLSGSLSGDTATTSLITVDGTNSLIGSIGFDKVGFGGNNQLGVVQISDTHYAVVSSEFSNKKGAVTFVNASNGMINGATPSRGGKVNAQNSIIGTVNDQKVGTNSDGAQQVFQLGTLGADSKIAVVNSGFAPGGGVLITDGKFVQATGTPGALTDDFGQFNGVADKGGENSSILRSTIINALNNGTAVTLKANNDITVQNAVVANSNATGALSLLAGRNINFNANVDTGNGNLTAIAGASGFDPQHRDAGDSTITLASGVSLNAGTGTINLVANNVGTNLGKFVNNAGATPFTAAKTFIYLPSFNTAGNNGVTHATLGGLTVAGKRYGTTFDITKNAPNCSFEGCVVPTSGVNLFYAARPTLTVAPKVGQTAIYGDSFTLDTTRTLSGLVDGDTESTAGITGTATFSIAGELPANGLRNAGQYDVAYQNGLASSVGYQIEDAKTQGNELTVMPRALTVFTNNFLSSATDTLAVADSTPLVAGQTFTGLNLSDTHELTAVFGQNTLASNYATTVVVPGATGSDLTVNRDLTVNGVNLTLQSDKNIVLRKTVTAQGANDKVTLNYGQGAAADNNTADYNFGLSPDGFAGKLNIHAGQNLSTKLGSDGTAIDYTVITALGEQGSTTGTDLQGMNGNLAGNFALGADINASSTSLWNNGAGFDGIGGITGSGSNEVQSPFTGHFTGLGHTVNGLTINRSNGGNVGLFDLTKTATLRDVGVVDAKVDSGFTVGALAGIVQDSMIQQVYSSGSVKASISNGGGLIGTFQDGRLKQAFSSSTVTGGRSLGGLIGMAQAANGQLQISEVFANGSVTGIDTVGGLMGSFFVPRSQQVSLTDAYAAGNVTASESTAGGLIGAVSVFGGLIIDNVYATGNVTITGADKASAGGLIGFLDILSSDSSMGPSSGSAMLQLSDSFFDTTTTGQSKEVGIIRPGGAITVPQGSKAAKGLATAELQARATFADAGWNIAGSGGALPVLSFGRSATVWTIGALQTPVTVTFNTLTGTFTYKAAEYALSDLFSTDSLFGTSCEVCTSWTLGTDYAFSFDSKTVTGFTDAGTYNNIGVQILNQDFALAETGNTLGSLTIDRARITGVTGVTAENRVYNGNTTASLNTSGAKFTGLLQNEAGTLTVATATGAFANKNVGDNKTVNINGITLGGTAAKNYVLDNSGTSTIPGVGLPGMPPGPPIIIQTPNTANTATTTANITRLDSVMWVGGATGNWFDAANWAGGAIPDLANVASVVLPANVKVTFNGAMDAVLIDTLGSLGSMDMVSGTLNVGTGGITLAGLNQTGGKLSTTGNLSVNQQDGTIQLGDLTVGGTMTVKTNGAISQLANTAIVVTGATSVDAGANDIALNGSNNDFGTVSLSGKAIALTDNKNGLVLGNINSTGNTFLFALGGGITQAAGTNMSVGGDTVVNGTFGDVTLDSVNNTFTGTVTGIGKDVVLSAKGALTSVLNTTGNSTLNASGNLAVSGSSGLGLTTTTQGENSTTTFGNTTVGGDLNVTSTGAVSQVADTTLSVKGNTAINAGIRDVNLSNAGNLFNSIGVTGGAVQIADKDGFALDTIKAASLAVKAGGAVTQVADKAIEVTGATSVDAGNNDVTLANANNDFNSVAITAKSASVVDKNAVVLDTIKAASLNVKSGGAVTQVADKAIEVTGATSVDAGANDVTLANANNDFNSIALTAKAASITDKNEVALDSIKAASLAVKAGGAVTQVVDKAIEVTGTTSVDAGANDVTLANANNDFNSIAVTAKAASITDKNEVALDSIKAASLAVKAGGAVTQVADKAIEVTGTTSVDASNNDVTLANANNDFNSVAITAKSASINDKNEVALDTIKAASLNVKSGGAVTQVADKAIEVTGATSVDAGADDVTLANAGNDFNSVAITAKSASIVDKNAVALDAIKAANLNIKAGGAVTQVADKAIEVTGATSVDAGANDVTLANANNDFNSIAVTAKAASITDKNAVALDVIKAASLNVKAGGAVTQVADKAVEVTGATSVDAGANAVTLANAGNDFGSIAVTAGAASVADKNAVVLDAIKATSLTLKAGGAVTQVADKALEVTGATSVDAGANAVTLANAGNDFGSIAVISGAASVTDKNAVVLDATTASSLTVKAGGAVTQNAAATVSGNTNVDATGFDVSLTNAGNNFNTVDAKAKDLAITDATGGVFLRNLTATGNTTVTSTGGDISQGDEVGTLMLSGTTTLNAKNGDAAAAVTLNGKNNTLTGAVTATGSDVTLVSKGALTAAVTATEATLSAAGNLAVSGTTTKGLTTTTTGENSTTTFGNTKVDGDLAVTSTGKVAQAVGTVLAVAGKTAINVGTSDVDLSNVGNDFNSIAVIAGAASITDKNAVALDAIKATSLTIKAGGAVTQVADKALEVTGVTSVDAGTNAVTLANTNNDLNSIAVTGGAVSINDKNAVALDAIKATSLTVKAGGAVTQIADKALEVTGATSVDAGTNAVTLANTNNDFNSIAVIAGAASITDKDGVALDAIKASSLTVKAGGAVTQVADKTLEVTGATSVDAGTNAVTLANTNNDFNSIAVTGGAVSINDKNAVALDAIKAASLTVKAGGAVTQVADKALEVTGATSVDAGPNAVTLANTNNDFNSIAVTGGAVSINDKNAVALDAIKATSLTVKAGGAVTQVADKTLEVTGATSVDAGTNAVTLANTNNAFNSIAVTAGAASITDKDGVALDTIKAASLTLTAGGAVTQVADKALEVTGATSVDAGTNAVTLANTNNDFNSIAVTGGAVSINDKNAVALDAIKATSLTVKAGGAVTQVANTTLTVADATSVDAGTNNVTLANAGNDFGSIGVIASAVSIADKNAIALDATKATSLTVKAGGAISQVADKALEVTGATSVDAGTNAVTLANSGNDFGSIGVTAGAASITDKNTVVLDALRAFSLTVKAGGDVTQSAAALVLGETSVDATGFDVSLTNAGNDFNTVTAKAKDLSIVDANGGVVLGDVVATGNTRVTSTGGSITQSENATMSVAGTTNVDAGKDNVSLGAAGNSFTGAVTATGSDVTLVSKGALTAAITAAEATLSAAGNLAVSGTTTKGLTTTTTGVNSTTTFGNTTVEGDLAVTSTGKVAQAADTVLAVAGKTAINAGANAVDLSNSGNAFSSIAVTGGAVSLTDKDSVALDAINATSLAVKAGGAVTQSAAALVTGATSVDATGFDVTLTNSGNDFGTVSANAKDLAIVDAIGGVVLGDVVTTGNLSVMTAGGGDITQTLDGSLLITGTSAFDSSNNIDLPNVTNVFVGSVTISGMDATLGSGALIRIEKRDVRSLTLLGGPNANMDIREAAIANAQALEPKLDLQIEREALEERSGDIAPFIIAANQPRAGGPAQLIVVNGGIKLPAGQQEEN